MVFPLFNTDFIQLFCVTWIARFLCLFSFSAFNFYAATPPLYLCSTPPFYFDFSKSFSVFSLTVLWVWLAAKPSSILRTHMGTLTPIPHGPTRPPSPISFSRLVSLIGQLTPVIVRLISLVGLKNPLLKACHSRHSCSPLYSRINSVQVFQVCTHVRCKGFRRLR